MTEAEKERAAVVEWLRWGAEQAHDALKAEEEKLNGGAMFWWRYWSGYYTGLSAAASAIEDGGHIEETPNG